MSNGSQSIDVITETDRASTLLHPLRLRMLEQLRRPESAAGLARRLRLPRQRVNYHLRELERERLVEQVEERRKGNCTERIMRSVAKWYLINPAVLGTLAVGAAQVQDRFSSDFLVALAADAIRDLAVVRSGAGKAGKRSATFGLQTEVRFASAGDAQAFAEELANQVGRLIAKYHDQKAPAGRGFRFILGGYPAIARKERGANTDERW